MKKQFYLAGILAAGMMTVTSCSNDDEPVIDNGGTENNEAAQEIVLSVSSTGDGLTTRAGRPLSSSDAAQDIDKVKVFILQEQDSKWEIKLTKEIDNWMSESQAYTTNGHGQKYVWKLSKDAEEVLNEGKYRVYAVGYTSNGSSYQIMPETGGDTFVDDLTTGGSFKWLNAVIQNPSTEGLGEEIFAGEIAEITVNADGEFSLEKGNENVLTLHRQVTGTLGYYVNIPTFSTGKKDDIVKETQAYQDFVKGLKLRMVVSNRNNAVQMAGFNTNFTTTGENVMYIVNGSCTISGGSFQKDAKFDGSQENDAYLAYEIKLGDWFVNGDVNHDGYLDEKDADGDNWRTPNGIDNTVDYQRGTVFAGQFLVPFAKVAGVKTMELQLVATTELAAELERDNDPTVAANTILRTWKINLPENDPQIVEPGEKGNRHIDILKDGVPVTWEGDENEEQRDSYSLLRNHLYTVGSISAEDNEPEDLSKGQSLILQVNDNWEMIHKMEVE